MGAPGGLGGLPLGQMPAAGPGLRPALCRLIAHSGLEPPRASIRRLDCRGEAVPSSTHGGVCAARCPSQGVCGGTIHDADSEYYRRIVWDAEASAHAGGVAVGAQRERGFEGAGSREMQGVVEELGLDGADALLAEAGPAGPAVAGAEASRAERLEQARATRGD